MPWPKPPPFFTQPFPAPVTDWDALPQATRDVWVQWAKANKVAYTDYHDMIRSGEEAYIIANQAASAAAGVSTAVVFPPPPANPQRRIISTATSSLTDGDSLAFLLATEALEDSTLLVWATAPNATPSNIVARDNVFIASAPIKAGQTYGQALGDIGTAYAAAWGTLAGKVGQTAVFFLFNTAEGTIQFAGSWSAIVQVISCAGLVAYWPLIENNGVRHSISRPADLQPTGPMHAEGGPIDFAITNEGGGPGLVSTPTAPNPNWLAQDWTINLYCLPTGTFSGCKLLRAKTTSPAASAAVEVKIHPSGNYIQVVLMQAGTPQTVSDSGAGALSTSAFTCITITNEVSSGNLTIYRDGVQTQQVAAGGTDAVNDDGLELAVMPDSGGSPQYYESDVSIWTRVLTAAEITAIAAANAGARFPFR